MTLVQKNSTDPLYHIILIITKSPQGDEVQGLRAQISTIGGSKNAPEIIIFGQERAHK